MISSKPAAPAAAIVRAEARLFAREPGALFWILVFPTALVCILGAIPSFRVHKPGLGGFSVVDLFVPVAVLVSMTLAAVQAMPQVVLAYRESGVLKRLRTTPASPSSLLAAQVVLHGGAVIVSSTLVLAVGRIGFGAPLPQSWPGYLLAYVLAITSAFSIGAVLTALSPNTRAGAAASSVVVFPMLFTAGVWTPVQAMPDLLRQVVDLTPLGAASEAMTQSMTGQFPGLVHLVVVATWAAAAGFLSVRNFRWE